MLMSLLLGSLFFGLYLLIQGQNQVTSASKQIREILLPAGRLFEQAKTEIDFQIQEINLISNTKNSSNADFNHSTLKLGPATKTLLNLRLNPKFPQNLKDLFEPWAKAVEIYNQKTSSYKNVSDSVPDLKEIRTKTQLLHKAIDRATSLELLELSEKSTSSVTLWLIVFAFGVFLFLTFAILIWRWLSPLETAEQWLRDTSRNEKAPLLPPPSSQIQRNHFFAPPREIQSLVSALRFHVEKFRMQRKELEWGFEKNLESEKSLGTLFSAIQVLSKHNEQLMNELIKNEKLASMGEMAAQLAHEIRNPLNSLNLKLELLREKLGEDQKPVLDRVLKEIDRLDALAESYLRTTKARLKDITTDDSKFSAWGPLIESIEENFLIEFRQKNIHFETKNYFSLHHPHFLKSENSSEGPYFEIPLNILKAVFLNLVKNAKESIELSQQTNRTILIQIESDEKSQPLMGKITVFDSGVGFDPKIKTEKIESFKTTKSTGSGLGLKTAQTMLEAFGSLITILNSDQIPKPFNAGVQISHLGLLNPREMRLQKNPPQTQALPIPEVNL
jgi:signal transduction histidine kinase